MSQPTATIALPFAKSHAFLIGIDDYEHVSPLRTATNDATEIGAMLREHHGFTVHGPLLNPGKDEMMRYLRKTMLSEVGKDDRIFLYFAGHGIALNGDCGPNGYLVPRDAQRNEVNSLIPMNEIHELIEELECRHGLMIFDCCFAGAFKWSSGYRDIVFDLPSVIYEERLYQYTQDPAWQVITSSACDQKAVDIMDNRVLGLREEKDDSPNSPFAQALMDGLMGAADVIPADGGDGVITTSELYTYLRDRVEDETSARATRQTPSMFSLGRHDKGQFIFLHPKHRLNLPAMPKRNPFMGLASYNESDRLFFYGRDRVIKELSAKIIDSPFSVVCGASGTGKSSVIKAGLLPLMRDQGWQILPAFRPGQEPMEMLRNEIPDIEKYMNAHIPSLLVIDQYEELVTQCLQEEDRQAFEEELARWIVKYPLLRIVITIRSDFEPQFTHTTLAPWWKSGRYVIPNFSALELREVIVKPTLQEVLFFEPNELIDVLIDAVNQAPGALPLLSFTLSELYHAYIRSGRSNRGLALEDYEELGGVIGALSMRANAIYDELDADYQRSMRTFMLRMVFFDGEKNASRRVLEDQLIYSDHTESARIHTVARKLVDARLLSSGRDEDGCIYYEPAHDALIHSWLRLQEWILSVGKSKLVLMYKLSLALADYEEVAGTSKAKEYLWDKNPRLIEILSDLESGDHNCNAREEEFIRASARQGTYRRHRNQLIVGAVMAILLLAFGFTVFQANRLKQQTLSLEQAQVSRMGMMADLMAPTDMSLAMRLAKEAYDSDSPAGYTGLLKVAYKGRTGNTPYHLLKRRKGKTAARLKFMGFVRGGKGIMASEISTSGTQPMIWNTLTGMIDDDGNGQVEKSVGQPDSGHLRAIDPKYWNHSFCVSPDFQLLVTIDAKGVGRLWNPDGALQGNLSGNGEGLQHVEFSQEGTMILAVLESGSIHVYDVEGQIVAHLSAFSPCISAHFSPDNQHIVSEHDDGNIRVWDRQDIGNAALSVSGFQLGTPVKALAFSPDGRWIIGGGKGTIRRYSVADEADSILIPVPASQEISTLDFASDGSRFLSGGADSLIRIWTPQGRLIGTTEAHPAAVTKARFTPDGTNIVSASRTQLSVFDSIGGSQKKSIYFGREEGAKHHYVITDFALSPSGDTLFTLTPWADGVHRWRFSNQDFGQPLNGAMNKQFGKNLGKQGFVAVSPDGHRFLVANSQDQEMNMYNAAGESVFKIRKGHLTPVKAVFSADSRFLLCAFDNQSLGIWDVNGKEVLVFFPHEAPITEIAIDPTGHYFATAAADGSIKLWPLSAQGVTQQLAKFEERDLSIVEKVEHLNYRIDQFEQEEIEEEALTVARHLSRKGRTTEAGIYFQQVTDPTQLTIAEKYTHLNYKLGDFLQEEKPEALLSAARYFHGHGEAQYAASIFGKAQSIGVSPHLFSVPEKIAYLDYPHSYFMIHSTNKFEVRDAARHYLAEGNESLSRKLFQRAASLHGSSNWSNLTPQERADYLDYDLDQFICENQDKADLEQIAEYFEYEGHVAIQGASDSVRQAVDRLNAE